MKSKCNFNQQHHTICVVVVFVVVIFVGFSSALITTSNAYSDNFNATTLIYAKPFYPASMPLSSPTLMSSSAYGDYTSPAASANSRTARRVGGLSNSCTTNDGASGTCLSRFNCMRLGGTVKGSCTTYSGICCETNLQCGQSSKLKRTIIRNPVQLASDDCLYVIEPYNSNVCQLLVEFENFELQQPLLVDTTLECMDYFEIGDYMLCGSNAQQHLYLPFNVASGIRNVPLNFHIPSRWSQTNWRLIVTQLECPAPKKRINLSFLPFVTDNSLQDARTVFSTHHSDWDVLAPPGCDQYFRQPTGNIKTFNYNENIPTLYMPNLNYVICVKPVPGAAMIEYTMRKFSLSKHTTAMNTFGFDVDCHAAVFTVGRSEDYLMIPQSTVPAFGNARPTYYCGILPDRSIVTAELPYIMYFNSDERTDSSETGFSIDYRVKSVLG